jgi:hypothetical protein
MFHLVVKYLLSSQILIIEKFDFEEAKMGNGNDFIDLWYLLIYLQHCQTSKF